MSRFPRVGDAGPTVGPDLLGPAGPAWTIQAAGYTVAGWPWFVVRRRGGRMVRLQLHAAQATVDGALAAIGAVVDSMPDLPGPHVL